MPVRARALSLLIAIITATTVSVAVPIAPARAAAPKVAIIVGPVGSLSTTYRSFGDRVADAATAAGATVVKAYSPNATWANVKAAVNGANIIVYFGHGNGFPSPYSSTENLDRVNGWGLNRTTTNGDGEAWNSTLAYCGEKRAARHPDQRGRQRATELLRWHVERWHHASSRLHHDLRAGALRPRLRRAVPGDRSGADARRGPAARPQLQLPGASPRCARLHRNRLR